MKRVKLTIHASLITDLVFETIVKVPDNATHEQIEDLAYAYHNNGKFDDLTGSGADFVEDGMGAWTRSDSYFTELRPSEMTPDNIFTLDEDDEWQLVNNEE